MEDIKLCKSFKFLSVNLEKILNSKLKAFDLSITQGLVLFWLDEAETGELPIKTIEKRYGTAQSTTLGIINRLEQKGLITTYLSEHRTKMVRIAPKSTELVNIIKPQIQAAEEQVFCGFTPGERLMFIELLHKIENSVMQQQGIKIEVGDYYER